MSRSTTWRRTGVWSTGLAADRACCNPARLSRLPGHYRRDMPEDPGRWQSLLYLNPDAR